MLICGLLWRVNKNKNLTLNISVVHWRTLSIVHATMACAVDVTKEKKKSSYPVLKGLLLPGIDLRFWEVMHGNRPWAISFSSLDSMVPMGVSWKGLVSLTKWTLWQGSSVCVSGISSICPVMHYSSPASFVKLYIFIRRLPIVFIESHKLPK